MRGGAVDPARGLGLGAAARASPAGVVAQPGMAVLKNIIRRGQCMRENHIVLAEALRETKLAMQK